MTTRLLTTLDNPYNPYTHFDQWNTFDIQSGYNTLAYMARLADFSSEISDAEQEQVIGSVVDEILDMNVTGNYILAPTPN